MSTRRTRTQTSLQETSLDTTTSLPVTPAGSRSGGRSFLFCLLRFLFLRLMLRGRLRCRRGRFPSGWRRHSLCRPGRYDDQGEQQQQHCFLHNFSPFYSFKTCTACRMQKPPQRQQQTTSMHSRTGWSAKPSPNKFKSCIPQPPLAEARDERICFHIQGVPVGGVTHPDIH